MKSRLGIVMFVASLMLFALAAVPAAQAQQQGENGPPKYIYLSTVSLKPGAMAQYRKLEETRIADLRAAKAPGHFWMMGQITGSGMLISIAGFDSFAEMQKDHHEVWSNVELASQLTANDTARGPLVRESHDSIYMFRKDLSLHADQSLVDMRFMLMWVVRVKPGHYADFENIAKAEAKAMGSEANVHWAVFEKMYGQGSGSTFLVATPMKSLGDVDTRIANRQKMRDMVGVGMGHLVMSMEGKAISMSESDLFAFEPSMSYVEDSWMKDSPDFWGKK